MSNSLRITLCKEIYSVLKAVKYFYVTLIIMIYFMTTNITFFFLKKDLFSTPKMTYNVTEKQLLTMHFRHTKPPPLYKTKYTFKSSFKKMVLKNLSSSIGRKTCNKNFSNAVICPRPKVTNKMPIIAILYRNVSNTQVIFGVMADH